MKKNILLLIMAILYSVTACRQQDDMLSTSENKTVVGKATVCAQMPTNEASTRTTMENYKNEANYDAFRVFWKEGDAIEAVAWQGDDASWYQNAKPISIPALSAENLSDENKKATFNFDIPAGFDSNQPLKIALFYVKDADNDTYSDFYKNNPLSFGIANKGLMWHDARIAKSVQPSTMASSPNLSYLSNRTPMMARMELEAGWNNASTIENASFNHLATLFGFKIYNNSYKGPNGSVLNINSIELSVDDGTKIFLKDAGILDPISQSVVSDENRTAAVSISNIITESISGSYTYYIPCILLSDLNEKQITFKVNGQTGTMKAGKNYNPGVCYSVDINWDGEAFSFLDHNQSHMLSYWLSPDGTVLLGWFGDESVVDLSAIPDLANVHEIDYGAFTGLKTLKKVIIGDNITAIGDFAFSATNNLQEVYIPASVVSMGEKVFNESSAQITVAEDNPNYSSLDGVLFNKEKSVLLHFPMSRTGTYIIPATVTEIGAGAFVDSQISSVVMPSSLETIAEDAFRRCGNLQEADFSLCTSLTTIGKASFEDCKLLKSVYFPGSLQTIDDNAFDGCENLAMVAFAQPSMLKTISYAAFNGNKMLTYFVIPPSVNNLGSYFTFSGCTSLKEITLPEEITKIPNGMLYGCANLRSITIPASVTSIEKNSFSNCNKLQYVYALPVSPPALKDTPGLKANTLYNVSASSQSDYQSNGWNNKMFSNFKVMKQCEVSSGYAYMASQGNVVSVNVTADTPWTSTCDQSWLVVAPSSGTGNETLSLTAMANTTGKTRAAYVVITAADAPTRLVQVVQGK